MITFLTLYLGLIVGPRHFELAVPETTARIEILLDGEQRAELTQAPWAFDLENIGFYYRQYHRLMEHWRSVVTVPVFELRYEDLVSDQESVTRSLVEFLGLKWDDSCLEFQKTQRDVTTASLHQVRQPMYGSSVSRYMNYEQHLKPLIKALDGII